jgi:hypothetical protein
MRGRVVEGEAAMSKARQVREVRGMRCCLVACWAEVRASHSTAMACARLGLERGRRMMVLVVGCRRGRASRWISKAPGGW